MSYLLPTMLKNYVECLLKGFLHLLNFQPIPVPLTLVRVSPLPLLKTLVFPLGFLEEQITE